MKKVFGGILFSAGLLAILLSQPSMTGNTIGNSASNLGSLAGVILVVAGVVLMTLPSGLEGKVVQPEDKQRIKSAFRQWNGRPTKAQKEILRQYNLIMQHTGSGHIAVYFPGSHRKVYMSSTPSDQREGLNFALKQLIPYIETNYRDNGPAQDRTGA